MLRPSRSAALTLGMIAAVLLGVGPASGTASEGKSAGFIAFERHVASGATEIYLMNSDGTNERRLARGCCLDWSPDGQRIAFYDDAVYVINVDGTRPRRVGDRPRLPVEPSLDWSPDGRRIAFEGNNGLVVVGSDGGEATRITNGQDSAVRWSPDGRKLVFERYLYEHSWAGYDIFVVNADGSGERRLTHGFGHSSPGWAPDGRRIAFESYTGGGTGNFEIFVMNADGSDLRNVTKTSAIGEGQPSWSPAGGRILFASSRAAIHTVKPDGSGRRTLARGHEPNWSGDGRNIAFSRLRHNNWDVYVMTASGQRKTKLTDTPRPTQETAPAWSPGG